MIEGRKPSLRLVFAITIALIGLVATTALAVLASRETSERLRRDIGADLAELAAHLADSLDRGMFERWRDIQIAAGSDAVRDPEAGYGAKSAMMDRLRSTYPDYAAVFFMTNDGIVRASTIPKVLGADVSKRDYFLEGRKAPFAGDVHDALLLASILGGDPSNPPRFVDLAAPVRGPDGAVVGVIAAHLYWSWAEELERSLRRAAQVRHPDIDVFVLARDGTVLLGPKALLKQPLATASARSAAAGVGGSAVETWADGRTYLSGYTRTAGYRDYPGLGWSVLVRQDTQSAFAPVGQVQRRIAVWGAVVALLTAVLAWFAAELVARPLRMLAGSATALGRGEPIRAPRHAPSEVGQVHDALSAAARDLQDKDRRQRLLINELNHRVKNTLATVQAMAMLTGRSAPTKEAYRENLEARIMSLSKTHDLLTAAAWETVALRDLLRTELEPYDDGSGRRIVLEGPNVPLAPRVAVPLGLAAHELATNAAKYGALSTPEGAVRVTWEVTSDGAVSHLEIVWKETGGPAVTPPTRRGFGSRLLLQGLARDLDGETHLDFATDGVSCRLRLPLSEATTKPVVLLEHRRDRPAIAASL